MGAVYLFGRRMIYVRQCSGGWSLTYVGPGVQKDLGVAPNLGAARNVATAEAFRIGRCGVSILGGEARP